MTEVGEFLQGLEDTEEAIEATVDEIERLEKENTKMRARLEGRDLEDEPTGSI